MQRTNPTFLTGKGLPLPAIMPALGEERMKMNRTGMKARKHTHLLTAEGRNALPNWGTSACGYRGAF